MESFPSSATNNLHPRLKVSLVKQTWPSAVVVCAHRIFLSSCYFSLTPGGQNHICNMRCPGVIPLCEKLICEFCPNVIQKQVKAVQTPKRPRKPHTPWSATKPTGHKLILQQLCIQAQKAHVPPALLIFATTFTPLWSSYSETSKTIPEICAQKTSRFPKQATRKTHHLSHSTPGLESCNDSLHDAMNGSRNFSRTMAAGKKKYLQSNLHLVGLMMGGQRLLSLTN